MSSINSTSALLLRIGLAFSFLYAAIKSFLDPDSWVGFFPEFTANIIHPIVALTLFSIFEIVMALWLLSGIKVRFAAIITAALMIGLVATNLPLMDILFRDVTIALAALSLAFLNNKEAKPANQDSLS